MVLINSFHSLNASQVLQTWNITENTNMTVQTSILNRLNRILISLQWLLLCSNSKHKGLWAASCSTPPRAPVSEPYQHHYRKTSKDSEGVVKQTFLSINNLMHLFNRRSSSKAFRRHGQQKFRGLTLQKLWWFTKICNMTRTVLKSNLFPMCFCCVWWFGLFLHGISLWFYIDIVDQEQQKQQQQERELCINYYNIESFMPFFGVDSNGMKDCSK